MNSELPLERLRSFRFKWFTRWDLWSLFLISVLWLVHLSQPQLLPSIIHVEDYFREPASTGQPNLTRPARWVDDREFVFSTPQLKRIYEEAAKSINKSPLQFLQKSDDYYGRGDYLQMENIPNSRISIYMTTTPGVLDRIEIHNINIYCDNSYIQCHLEALHSGDYKYGIRISLTKPPDVLDTFDSYCFPYQQEYFDRIDVEPYHYSFFINEPVSSSHIHDEFFQSPASFLTAALKELDRFDAQVKLQSKDKLFNSGVHHVLDTQYNPIPYNDCSQEDQDKIYQLVLDRLEERKTILKQKHVEMHKSLTEAFPLWSRLKTILDAKTADASEK